MEANKTESKYERLRKIGIGSYGVVFKCINRQTGQIVAIKRYSENDTDPIIRKIAMREVRMLRQLKHPNLINLIEVFRRKRRLHLVFDYCELTVLDVIEKYANSCPSNLIKKIVWQTVNGIDYCHSHNCIHRDIKPENILINQSGVVKLCDFGFARDINRGGMTAISSSSSPGGFYESARSDVTQETKENSIDGRQALGTERQAFTEYVATRWYRAPELLIGDIYYDTKIDIWAIGCVTAELMRGEPIWAGKTDFDQLCLIKSTVGQLTASQSHTLLLRRVYSQTNIEQLLSHQSVGIADSLERKLPVRIGLSGHDFVASCLHMDPAKRLTTEELLKHVYIHSARMVHISNRESNNQNEHRLSSTYPQAPVSSSFISADFDGRSTNADRSNSQSLMLYTNNTLSKSKDSVVGVALKQSSRKSSAIPRANLAASIQSRQPNSKPVKILTTGNQRVSKRISNDSIAQIDSRSLAVISPSNTESNSLMPTPRTRSRSKPDANKDVTASLGAKNHPVKIYKHNQKPRDHGNRLEDSNTEHYETINRHTSNQNSLNGRLDRNHEGTANGVAPISSVSSSNSDSPAQRGRSSLVSLLPVLVENDSQRRTSYRQSYHTSVSSNSQTFKEPVSSIEQSLDRVLSGKQLVLVPIR